MASSTKHLSLFFLLTLLSFVHTHARESQFFNKISAAPVAAVAKNVQPLHNQPNFLPENENNYGLYGHDSAKKPLNNDDDNPVAYVSEPEDINDTATSMEDDKQDSTFRDNINRGSNNYKYNGGNNVNHWPSDTRFGGGATFWPQGMSDTRFLENGKYFYNVNRDKYNNNHPQESMRGNWERNEYNTKNMYGNMENAYDQIKSGNSMGGYQNPEEFQDEETNMP